MPEQNQPDLAQSILGAQPFTDELKANSWEVFHNTEGEEFEKQLKGLSIPDSVKADLWEAKTNPDKFALSRPDVVKPPAAAGPHISIQEHNILDNPDTVGKSSAGVTPAGKLSGLPGVRPHEPSYREGVSDVLLAGAPLAPLATVPQVVGGVVGGTAGGYAVERGAKALGAGPTEQELAGTAGTLVGSVAGGYTGGKVSSIPKMFPPRAAQTESVTGEPRPAETIASEQIKPLSSSSETPETAPMLDEVKERNLRHVLGDYSVDALGKSKEGVAAAQQLSNATNTQYADVANYEGVLKPKALAEKTGKEWTTEDFKRTVKEHGKELNPNKELVLRHLIDRYKPSEIMKRTEGWGRTRPVGKPGGFAEWKGKR